MIEGKEMRLCMGYDGNQMDKVGRGWLVTSRLDEVFFHFFKSATFNAGQEKNKTLLTANKA